MGEIEPSSPDPAQMRVSDKERHQVAEMLQQAAGEGRLDFTELEARLDAVWSAKTYGDLAPITADLRPAAQPMAGTQVPASSSSIAVMSATDRKGIWTVAERHTAVAVMGGINIDLREVQFTARETVINAHAIMGAVDIVVNARTRVVVDGLGLLGAFDQVRDEVAASYDVDSPVVRITGLALMGAVGVVRKADKG